MNFLLGSVSTTKGLDNEDNDEDMYNEHCEDKLETN